MSPTLARTLACLTLLAPAYALEVEGLLDQRLVYSNSPQGWLEGGLGKQRHDARHDGLRLGQAMLLLRGELADTVSAQAVINLADDRASAFDVSEAWLRWKPLPTGPWRHSAKVGAFFPAVSLEHDGLGWTTTRTLSASAINSWIGEELRTIGLEYTLARPGRFAGSPHDISLSLAAFKGNDPAGTLIAWRGWGVGDRITGLTEKLPLPDLPVYRDDGRIAKQDSRVDNFRELDGRWGYHAGLHYGYGGRLELSAFHYDNRADPLVVNRGQYAWTTRFKQLALRWRPDQEWEILSQWLAGSTVMGRNAVNAAYRSAYVLAAHPLGSGKLAVRYDYFSSRERDRLPEDPNGEHGQALALAYSWPWRDSLSVMAEGLVLRSERPARQLLSTPSRQTERSLSLALRWRL
ncbi:hypothetical protein GCM10007907_39840 [Chitinimonas prasina]|uniref:Porin n=1 Tax=Chitinimonas prasina TaxID=1434937 RepID=A0ABQ5YQJ5_9NEIS|nr:hypothetical protein [Chitinimonas prasina]GLR15194.1 hypothetical protein GCM10007907_39840 [Chitinimonas prasina]